MYEPKFIKNAYKGIKPAKGLKGYWENLTGSKARRLWDRYDRLQNKSIISFFKGNPEKSMYYEIKSHPVLTHAEGATKQMKKTRRNTVIGAGTTGIGLTGALVYNRTKEARFVNVDNQLRNLFVNAPKHFSFPKIKKTFLKHRIPDHPNYTKVNPGTVKHEPTTGLERTFTNQNVNY